MPDRYLPTLELSSAGLPVISAREVAIGYPLGSVALTPPPAHIDPDPVRALREALRPALLCPPCVVAFSGGRDSSLLLALAADTAAREGLEPPIALTFRYPGDPAADESSWQELVVAHLRGMGLRMDWCRYDVTTEMDLIGPLTAPVLSAHRGPTFPAGLGNTILLARHARGGSLVTGNAGDEVLGAHRVGVLRAVLRRRGRGLTRADWKQAVACAAPPRVRARIVRSEATEASWLRPVLRRATLEERMRAVSDFPLRWDRSVWATLVPRAVHIGRQTRDRLAGSYDCELVEPLASLGFVASYAAFGGRWGGLTRTGGTRLLAAGMLPDSVIARPDRPSSTRPASARSPGSSRVRGTGAAWTSSSSTRKRCVRPGWRTHRPPRPRCCCSRHGWPGGRLCG